jgi:DNA polymerase III subunit delta'
MTWDLIGHEWAASLLSEHIAHGRVRHAYLFTGPQGVGRRTLAVRFGQALNCTQPAQPGVPCGQCLTCRQMEKLQHPDLSVVQAEKVGGTLKVEQVRELQHSLALTPYSGNYRIALMLRFEEAHNSAANALLKTLEEPAKQVVLILTAESTDSLLPTVVSRCEVIRLNPLPLPVVFSGLQARLNLPDEQARLLAHLSGGRPGYAMQLHNQPERLEKRQTWLDDHARLLNSNRANRFAYADPLSRDKETTREILLVWLSLWRDIMLQAAGAAAPITNLDRQDEITDLSSRVGFSHAHNSVLAHERTLDLLDKNINTRLALEVLFLNLPGLSTS